LLKQRLLNFFLRMKMYFQMLINSIYYELWQEKYTVQTPIPA
jgi:hypothetical protein